MIQDLRILLLEDNPDDAELLQRLLKKDFAGASFRHSVTQADFLMALTDFRPDLILADNSLPQFDAAEALRIVRQLEMETAFIMVSGTLNEEKAVDMIKRGADDYILKGSMTRLPAAIETAINIRRSSKERKLALLRLSDSEEKYRVIVQRISDAFISLDNNWCYTYLNHQAGELIKRNPADMLGKNVWEEFPDAVGSATYDAFQRAMKEQRYISNIDYYAPLDLWQENHIYPSPDGLSVFIRNITEKKKLELALQEQRRQEQLHLTAATLEAQEKERNAIGLELHDNVNQILAGINVFLRIVLTHPDRMNELLPMCVENLEVAIAENRKIAHELVTPDLRKETLVDRISKLCDTMLREAGIEIYIHHDDLEEELLTETQRLAVYRISQEQCSNILKYAKASTVVITMDTDDAVFTLRITDDGKGASPEKLKQGIGLRNMNSRVSVLEGSMQVHTGEGNGFELEVMFPLA
ncbi:MAG: response regulator [Chitinophagaceae bacterium]|nr:response regulator [Chitinophagaceae bacterium]